MTEKSLSEILQEACSPLPKPPELERYRLALVGIASCATQCLCCEMHRRIAVKALGHDVEIVTDTLDI